MNDTRVRNRSHCQQYGRAAGDQEREGEEAMDKLLTDDEDTLEYPPYLQQFNEDEHILQCTDGDGHTISEKIVTRTLSSATYRHPQKCKVPPVPKPRIKIRNKEVEEIRQDPQKQGHLLTPPRLILKSRFPEEPFQKPSFKDTITFYGTSVYKWIQTVSKRVKDRRQAAAVAKISKYEIAPVINNPPNLIFVTPKKQREKNGGEIPPKKVGIATGVVIRKGPIIRSKHLNENKLKKPAIPYGENYYPWKGSSNEFQLNLNDKPQKKKFSSSNILKKFMPPTAEKTVSKKAEGIVYGKTPVVPLHTDYLLSSTTSALLSSPSQPLGFEESYADYNRIGMAYPSHSTSIRLPVCPEVDVTAPQELLDHLRTPTKTSEETKADTFYHPRTPFTSQFAHLLQ